MQRHHFENQTQLNTIWYFEKDTSLPEDCGRLYDVTYVEYMSKVKCKMAGSEVDIDLNKLVNEMGGKGWTLVSILDVPMKEKAGMTTWLNSMVLFFQRPFIPKSAPGIEKLSLS